MYDVVVKAEEFFWQYICRLWMIEMKYRV